MFAGAQVQYNARQWANTADVHDTCVCLWHGLQPLDLTTYTVSCYILETKDVCVQEQLTAVRNIAEPLQLWQDEPPMQQHLEQLHSLELQPTPQLCE